MVVHKKNIDLRNSLGLKFICVRNVIGSKKKQFLTPCSPWRSALIANIGKFNGKGIFWRKKISNKTLSDRYLENFKIARVAKCYEGGKGVKTKLCYLQPRRFIFGKKCHQRKIISPSKQIFAVGGVKLRIYTLQNPFWGALKVTPLGGYSKCDVVYFVQLDKSSSFIKNRWTKQALVH